MQDTIENRELMMGHNWSQANTLRQLSKFGVANQASRQVTLDHGHLIATVGNDPFSLARAVESPVTKLGASEALERAPRPARAQSSQLLERVNLGSTVSHCNQQGAMCPKVWQITLSRRWPDAGRNQFTEGVNHL